MNGKQLNILIVEDEPNLGSSLQEFLETQGYQSIWAKSCEEATNNFVKHSPSVVLMDIGLPDGDGLNLARKFRSLRKDFVLLFLSAQNTPEIKVEGLELGADDYITKPFDLRELTLRLNRILKTAESISTVEDEINIGQLKIWFSRYQVENSHGELINLTQKECAILDLLYHKQGQVISRDEIIETIWGENMYPSSRTVDNYIVKLRKWAETDSSNKLNINTIRGIGYKLEIK